VVLKTGTYVPSFVFVAMIKAETADDF